ncbi:MAG: hypothetical protein HY220_02555 [Candidatus Sungbacteria bacterium]|uniref:Translation elongation factor-like protein n=1 Tax=Candidatus Sungiibacteriota bacterium TaxID=2750080 RepID=A0A9D6LRR9_9BACT|nr:hypothetical protein [Candidatus Sungbacteria bacterium]
METPIGKVVHYFGKVGAAVVKLTQPLAVGDKIKIKDGENSWEQEVASMQVDRVAVSSAKAGDEVAIKLDSKAREGALLIVEK